MNVFVGYNNYSWQTFAGIYSILKLNSPLKSSISASSYQLSIPCESLFYHRRGSRGHRSPRVSGRTQNISLVTLYHCLPGAAPLAPTMSPRGQEWMLAWYTQQLISFALFQFDGHSCSWQNRRASDALLQRDTGKVKLSTEHHFKYIVWMRHTFDKLLSWRVYWLDCR